MVKKSVLFFLTFLHFKGLVKSACPVCTDVSHFSHLIENNTIQQGTFKIFTDFGFLLCIQQCLLRTRCQSVNFNISSKICDLNQQSGELPTARVGSITTNIIKWPKRLALVCENHTCLNGSVCQGLTDAEETSVCIEDDISPLDKGYKKATALPFFYKIYEDKQNYSNAKNICEFEGGRLLEPDSEEKDNFIRNIVQDLKLVKVLFGATDMSEEGEWRWVSSNKTLTFSNWGQLEPAISNTDNCVIYNEFKRYLWSVCSCDVTLPFICEITPA